MNQKEQQLEEISEKVNNYEPMRHLPHFELFVTLISIAMAIMLFLFPNMLADGAEGVTSLYGLLLSIMPQWLWAFVFFGSGVLKAIGLLVDSKILRISGLIVSAFIYAVFAISYSVSFPAIGSVVFTAITVFSLISVSEVKRSGLND